MGPGLSITDETLCGIGRRNLSICWVGNIVIVRFVFAHMFLHVLQLCVLCCFLDSGFLGMVRIVCSYSFRGNMVCTDNSLAHGKGAAPKTLGQLKNYSYDSPSPFEGSAPKRIINYNSFEGAAPSII